MHALVAAKQVGEERAYRGERAGVDVALLRVGVDDTRLRIDVHLGATGDVEVVVQEVRNGIANRGEGALVELVALVEQVGEEVADGGKGTRVKLVALVEERAEEVANRGQGARLVQVTLLRLVVDDARLRVDVQVTA